MGYSSPAESGIREDLGLSVAAVSTDISFTLYNNYEKFDLWSDFSFRLLSISISDLWPSAVLNVWLNRNSGWNPRSSDKWESSWYDWSSKCKSIISIHKLNNLQNCATIFMKFFPMKTDNVALPNILHCRMALYSICQGLYQYIYIYIYIELNIRHHPKATEVHLLC